MFSLTGYLRPNFKFWPVLLVLIAAKSDLILFILAAITYLYQRPKNVFLFDSGREYKFHATINW
jgi:hypothetical protein